MNGAQAFCPKCDCLTLPRDDGRCLFCDTATEPHAPHVDKTRAAVKAAKT